MSIIKIENQLLKKIQTGFSLIEISLVLVIVGLLLGGLMAPLATQMESSRRNESKLIISQALEAIYGYILTNGRLPCPDTTGDGAENRTGNNCTVERGNLPWSTLALGSQDAWGRAYLYRVTNSFADLVDGTGCGTPTVNMSFSFCSVGDIQILDSSGGTPMATNVPAVIISKGKNFGAAALGADETENNDNDAIFVDKSYSGVAGAEYDDIISWVVPGLLLNRMVSAGRLP